MNIRASKMMALATAAWLMGALSSFAESEVVNGITWTYSISNGEASIGSGSSTPAISIYTHGDISIPSTLGGCRVTSIGDDAFASCSSLTSVTIPPSVRSIGSDAFYKCGRLSSMTIPRGVEKIGSSAFWGCINLMSFSVNTNNSKFRSENGLLLSKDGKSLVYGVNGDVVIPDGVTSIQFCAFAGYSRLTSVTIPDSVTSIGESAFFGCIALTSVTIPNSVKSIGESAFSGCKGLTNMTIPNSVKSIERGMFGSCVGLTSVTIPDSISSIGENAFHNCSSLTSVTIPDSVTSIGENAFRGCGLSSVTIGMGVTSIGTDAFYGCTNLTSVHISDVASWCGITFADREANPLTYAKHPFLNGTEVRNLIIPSSVTSIGKYAFRYCSGLASVTIPDGVTSIGEAAFSGCSNLVTVTIPASVMSIENYAFSGCSSLVTVTIPASVTSIGNYAFSGCRDLLSVTIPSMRLEYLFPSAYQTITNVVISNGETYIGPSAFSGCSGLISVTIPNSVESIEGWAFQDCCNLISLTIPNGVTSIGIRSFWNCSGLTALMIPDSVTSIGSDAFSGCSSLGTIWLPSGRFSISSMSIPTGCNVVFYKMVTLTVSSDMGISIPEIGTHSYKSIDSIECSMTTGVIGDNMTEGTRYFCTGWRGTGSIPSRGTGTNVTVAITKDSSLTWQWEKQNLVSVTVSGGSCAFGTQWIADGTTATATIVPATHLYSISLSGDTDGVTLSGTTLSIPSDRPREITVAVEEVKVSFDSITAYGETSPVVGHTEWSWGDEVVVFVDEPEPTNGIRYVCTGWAGTGSVPASGTGTNVTFTIEEDSTLTWLWETNVWTECTVSGDASTTPVAEWRRQNGEALVIPFSIDNAFFGWSLDGDADGVIVDEVGKGISIPADRPRQIEASFVSVETAVGTGGKPLSWNGYSAKWRPTFDTNAPGGSCLRTLATDANASSAVSATVSGSGRLSFDWRISAGRGDTCKFYVDGVEQNGITRSTSWTTVSVNIGSGNHTLEWVYSRGSGSATGEDAAFIDNVDWRPDVTLAVASAFGNPSPTAGTHSLVYGDSVSASVTAPEAVDGTRRVCTGWSGSGSLPANGTGTTVSFVINNDSTLVWNWRTDYLTTLQVAGPVGADFAGEWLNSGTTKVVHWTPTVPYFTIALSGDIQGIILDEASRTLTIPANSPRNITLTVTELTLSSALDTSNLVWTTTGAASWFPQVAISSDSADAVQSGQVIGDDASALETTLSGPGVLVWSWLLDSSGNAGVDVLLDGVWLDSYAPGSQWTRETLEVTDNGEHTLRFEFWNAGTLAAIGDCAYIDQVSWTPATSQTVVIGEVEVPAEWLSSEAATILSANGGNYEAAANAMAANGVNKVWECYVAGISPTNAAARFEARIDFVDGHPVVKWNPDLNEDGTKHERVYTVEGKENLADSWAPANSASRFFRVKVSMP